MDSVACRKSPLVVFLCSIVLFTCLTTFASPAHWTHLSTVTGDLPLPNGGSQQTATLVLDIDRDGVNDFVITERTQAPSVVWNRRGISGWTKYIIDNSHLNVEAGGAFSDIDGDGDPDIVFGGDSQSNQVWWWENPYPNYNPSVPWTRHVIKNSGYVQHHDEIFGDFKGDGHTELVFWNQAAGTLFMATIPANPANDQPWPLTPVFTYMNSIHEGLAKADIDGDGIDDIIGGGNWYKYNSNGTFTANTIDNAMIFSRAAAGQLVAGGHPEVVFQAGDWDGPLRWYEWNGSSWTTHELLPTVIHGHSLQVADMNGDGYSDIFSAEMRLDGGNPDAKTRIFYGDGSGNFTRTEIATSIGNHESKVADLDGDGDIDILGKPYNWNAPRVDIWLNEGNGDHPSSLNSWRYIQADSTRTPSSSGNGTFGLDFADVNRDGYQDVASGRYFYRNPGGDMLATPWPRVTLPNNPTNGHPVDAALFFDAEGNGLKDDIIAEDLPFVLWLKANDSQGNSWTPTVIAQVPPTSHGNGRTVKIAHIIPSNTKPDILLSGGGGTYLMQIPSNLGTNWPIMKITSSSNDEQKAIGIGDINRDGSVDIAVAIGANRFEVDWWKNPGNGSINWTKYVIGNTNAYAKMIEVSDVNGDGRLDVIVTEEAQPASVYWFEAAPDPTTGTWIRHTVATGLDEVDSMTDPDMNNDGQPDIVVGETFGARRTIAYENVGGGTSWNTHVIDSLHESHNGARGVDLNHDGHKDIVSVAYYDYSKMHVWKNDSIPSAPLPSAPVLLNPANNSPNVSLTPVLKWRNVQGATSFRLQLSVDSSFVSMAINSIVSDTTLTVPPLTRGTAYFWRTRSINSAGEGSWSAVWRFTTIDVPRSPALISPAQGAIHQPLGLGLVWFRLAEADSYHVQVSTDSLFGGFVRNEKLIDTLDLVSGLSGGTLYYWRTSGINVAGGGPWSGVWRFTTISVPSSPALTFPPDGALGQLLSLRLMWLRSAEADSYHVQISTDSLFGNLVRNDRLGDTLDFVSGLTAGTRYFWRIAGVNQAGEGQWSASWHFTTISVPQSPGLILPVNDAVDQQLSLRLVWFRSVQADSYHVQISTDSLFSGLVRNNSVNDTLDLVSGLTNSTRYYWRVGASNVAGSGPWSPIWHFTTIVAVPPPPGLASPLNASTNVIVSPVLTWNASPGAATYRLQLALDSLYANSVLDDSMLASLSFRVDSLQFFTTYFWHVQARNPEGVSTYSGTWFFTTALPGPSLSAPANGASGIPTSVTFVWNAVPHAASYQIQLAVDSSFGATTHDSSFISTSSCRIDSLGNSTRYYWRIRAWNPPHVSNWSTAWNFETVVRTPDRPILIAPPHMASISSDTVRMVWHKSGPQVFRYWLELARDSSFSQSVIDSTVHDTAKVVGVSGERRNYWWRVRAMNQAGWGAFSEVRFFSTIITGVNGNKGIPQEFSLSQNHPNPFNPSTLIRYGLPRSVNVKLEVYNLIGQRVATLVDEVQEKGYHEARFEPADLASGVYLYRLQAGEYLKTKKLLLLR